MSPPEKIDILKPSRKKASHDFFSSQSESSLISKQSDFRVPTPPELKRSHTAVLYMNENNPRRPSSPNLLNAPPKSPKPVTSEHEYEIFSTSEEEYDSTCAISQDALKVEEIRKSKSPEYTKTSLQQVRSVTPELLKSAKTLNLSVQSRGDANSSISDAVKVPTVPKVTPDNQNHTTKLAGNQLRKESVSINSLNPAQSDAVKVPTNPKPTPDNQKHKTKLARKESVKNYLSQRQHLQNDNITSDFSDDENNLWRGTKSMKAPPPSQIPPGGYSVRSCFRGPGNVVKEVETLKPLYQARHISQKCKALMQDGKPKNLKYADFAKRKGTICTSTTKLNLGSVKIIPKGRKDYVRDNAISAIRTPAKIPVPTLVDDHKGHKSAWSKSGLCRDLVFKEGFGEVPKYIHYRKCQLLKEENEIRCALKKHGYVCSNPMKNGMNQIALLGLLTKMNPQLQIGTTGLNLTEKVFQNYL